MLESRVKAKVRALLKQYGAYYFTPVGSAFGKAGVPDIVACLNGRFIGIECKVGNKKPTALQYAELGKIFSTGGVALVINDRNLMELDACLSYVTTLTLASGYGNFETPEEMS